MDAVLPRGPGAGEHQAGAQVGARQLHGMVLLGVPMYGVYGLASTQHERAQREETRMTCQCCRRPEHQEYLTEAHVAGPPPRIELVCRRCQLPAAVQAHWDAMHAAEVAVIAAPEDSTRIDALRQARSSFDLELRGVGKPPRRRRR